MKYLKIIIILVVAISIVLSSCANHQEITISEEEPTLKEVNYYMIDLRGEVYRPGIYKVQKGSLIIDVINLAGGLREEADLSQINLVEMINDNCKIIINKRQDPSTTVENKVDKDNNKININTCTIEQLMTLPNIGSVKAKAIVEYRKANGSFKSIDNLLEVTGIGQSLFNQIKDLITV